ncbi:hypothetical protein C1T28_21015 [Bacillus subtilis]|nr:hypothetical protein C1T28_21015 [Bacillus subtilis]
MRDQIYISADNNFSKKVFLIIKVEEYKVKIFYFKKFRKEEQDKQFVRFADYLRIFEIKILFAEVLE